MAAKLAHPTPTFKINQRQPTQDRLLRHPQLSAVDPMVPGHLPTLQGLTLKEPIGSRRELIYFIGLFQQLQDLKLLCDRAGSREKPGGDLTLSPPFIPPLQGLLTMRCYTGVALLKEMIDLFGGFRFHHMDLFKVDGMRLLLDACAETLESVVLHPTDPRSEQLFPKTRRFLSK